MTETAVRARVIMTRASRPRLAAHVRLREDMTRGRWLILAPERVFNPDAVAVEVLKRLDGTRTVEEIAAALATMYAGDAGTILADVTSLLQDLGDRGVVTA